MLCQFTFKNFKSYKNETTLDMQAVSHGFEDSLLKSRSDDTEFLPVSVIYGPNGGGKSNVLEAFRCMYHFILRPIWIMRTEKKEFPTIKCTPFLFDETSQNEPTEFEVYFRPKREENEYEYEYRYTLSVLNGEIYEESLYRHKLPRRGQSAMIFERSNGEIKLGASINKASIETEVNDRMPYLSFLYIFYKLEPVIKATDWFRSCFFQNYARFTVDMRRVPKHQSFFKKQILDVFSDVGINVSNYEILGENNEDIDDILFKHPVKDSVYDLSISLESDGTRKLFALMTYLLAVLRYGDLAILDELDASLHPKLLRYIIMLFKNPEINKNNAQLIFTSHDISTMKSSVYRTDEIWFACKTEDESSDLYSLYDIRDESGNRIKPDAAFDKQYLEGRYGADPYFSNMMKWEDD
ncbi:MAG: AAA family ATPase [Ruminococcus sp.]|nr:AAA family ATPase [Ruminococcus sp.]